MTIPTAQIIKVLQTSANDLDSGLILFDMVTAIGTDIDMLITKHNINTQASMFWDIWLKNTLKLSTRYSPSTMTQLLLLLHGQGVYCPVKLNISMNTNPYSPSKNTNFKGLSEYLLKIHFYETWPPPLKTREAKRSMTPKIWLSWVEEELLKTVITCTPVIPIKAIKQPRMAFLENFFLRKKKENIAVVMMTPPLEICQTLLATIFKAI